MGHRIRKDYKLRPETVAAIEQIRDSDEQLTGIRPTATAVVEAAVLELRRRKLGRRAADMVPVKKLPRK